MAECCTVHRSGCCLHRRAQWTCASPAPLTTARHLVTAEKLPVMEGLGVDLDALRAEYARSSCVMLKGMLAGQREQLDAWTTELVRLGKPRPHRHSP